MRRSEHSGCKLGGVLLAAATVIVLTIGTILAQSNPPGSAGSAQDEPIKRTVLFRGDLEGAPGKEIVIFVADLAPGAVGAKHLRRDQPPNREVDGRFAHSGLVGRDLPGRRSMGTESPQRL